MRIRFLGTGYGECKIKKAISRDYRRRGGVLIDDRLLLDAPSDIFEAAGYLGFEDELALVANVIISHSHEGHFSPEAVMRLAKRGGVNVYASDRVLGLIPECAGVRRFAVYPFVPFELDGYRVIPLPSNHSTDIDGEDAFNYIITGDRALLYALDGGFVSYDAWKVIREVRLDGVIADCALANMPISPLSMHHNNIEAVKKMKELFICAGVAGDNIKFLLSHIPTDKKRSIHDELTPIAQEYGLTLAYDGYYFAI